LAIPINLTSGFRMHLLAFYPYVPYPMDRGAYYRGFHLLRELARVHDVDLLALAENGEGLDQKPVFAEFCRRVEFVSFQHPAWPKLIPTRLMNPLPATVAHWTLPQARHSLQRLLSTERYDAIHIFDIILAQYFLHRHTELPLVADRTRVDLQYQLMERKRLPFQARAWILNLENLAKLWCYERRVAGRSALQVVCGPDDHAFIRRYINRQVAVAVIPNGVDTCFFHPGSAPGHERSAHPTVLFCGAMDYNPNIDALRWYFAQIHEALLTQCPDLRLFIVGKAPTEEVKRYATQPNVVVTGGVPDVRPYYAQAWLQIVPLRIGGGTRLKIVESMAMGTPVVSTPIGAQGLPVRHDHDILLAESAADFIRQTARALQEPALRGQLRSNGLSTVQARLSWPLLGCQLGELYSTTFGSQPRTPPPTRSPVLAAR
jgi:polysaccharide biosynthesis protein PslH